jgi:hypothetical protein
MWAIKEGRRETHTWILDKREASSLLPFCPLVVSDSNTIRPPVVLSEAGKFNIPFALMAKVGTTSRK